MAALLKLALAYDWLAAQIGKAASWAVWFAALISSGNAFVRYGFDISSNGWLEIQWYLFAAMVMLGAPYVLKLNEHVRVDIIYGKLKGNGPVYVDIFGLIFFLSWPLFMSMYISKEMSPNAGGLIRWPAMMLLPVGLGMMFLQGISEIIKRVSYLTGKFEMDTHYEKPVQ